MGPLHHCDVVSCPLIGLGKGVGAPVSPVDLTAEHGDSEGVRQVLMTPENLYQTRTVVLRRVDGVRSKGRNEPL